MRVEERRPRDLSSAPCSSSVCAVGIIVHSVTAAGPGPHPYPRDALSSAVLSHHHRVLSCPGLLSQRATPWFRWHSQLCITLHPHITARRYRLCGQAVGSLQPWVGSQKVLADRGCAGGRKAMLSAPSEGVWGECTDQRCVLGHALAQQQRAVRKEGTLSCSAAVPAFV